MNRLAKWMMRLYPARWRARYGDELNALLADTGADARVVTDLFKGGIRMQFSAWSFLKLAIVLGLVGALLGFSGSYLGTPEYTSTAVLEIKPAAVGEALRLNEVVQQVETEVLSRPSLAAIINSAQLQLYADQSRGRTSEEIIEEMRGNISIHFVDLPAAPGKGSDAIAIAFRYPERFKAQETVRAITTAFMSDLQQAPMILTSAQGDGSLLVIDQASWPNSPLYPKRQSVWLAGFVFGVLLACIWRLLQRRGFIAKRFALVAITFGLAGLAGIIVADDLKVIPCQYRSTATLHLVGGSQSQLEELKNTVFGRLSLLGLVTDPRLALYKEKFSTMTLEDVYRMMKQRVAIRQVGYRDGPIFTVSFEYPDSYKAERTVSALINNLIEAERRLHPNAAPQPPPTPLVMDLLHKPSLPNRPSWPNRRSIAVTGGIAGIIVAAMIAIIRRRWKPDADIPVNVHE